MAKVLDMKRFQTLKELQEYCNEQFSTILNLQTQLNDANYKIEHLEELLKNGGVVLAKESNELALCKLEIQRLYQEALLGPLDDKQIRAFDLYCKNLLAIQGKVAPEKPKKKEATMTPEELIGIALQAMPANDEQ